MEYKTIARRAEARFIEKKSEFIGYLAPVSAEEEAISFLNEIRAMHRKAKHNCYAYILREGIARHSDDGEPSGTAGAPIYDVLCHEGLTDIACVVTRYFGGVLLGTGGLVRTYTKAVSEAIASAEIKVMARALQLNLTFDYSLYNIMPGVFARFDVRVGSEEFADNVRISLYVRSESAEEFIKAVTELSNGRISVEQGNEDWYDFAKQL